MKAFIFYAYATAVAVLIGHSLLGQLAPTSLSNRLPSSSNRINDYRPVKKISMDLNR